MSPNVHSVYKHCFAVQIPEPLYRQIEKLADKENVTVTEYIVRLVREAAAKVELTAEDDRIIDERVAHRMELRRSRKNGGK